MRGSRILQVEKQERVVFPPLGKASRVRLNNRPLGGTRRHAGWCTRKPHGRLNGELIGAPATLQGERPVEYSLQPPARGGVAGVTPLEHLHRIGQVMGTPF